MKEFKGLTESPCREVTAQPINSNIERFLTNEEQKLLLEVSKSFKWHKLYLLILMALTTGEIRGEILGLKWKDINKINKTALLIGAENIIKNNKGTKTGDSRVLPLTDTVIKEL